MASIITETVKLLEKNTEKKILHTGLGNAFLLYIPKAEATQVKKKHGTTSN